MGKVFILLTNGASFHIVRYPLVHVGPPVPFLGFMDCFISAWMTGSGMVVHQGHDAAFYFSDGWYMDFTFWCNSGNGEPLGVEQLYPLVVGFAFVHSGEPREHVRWDIGFSWDVKCYARTLRNCNHRYLSDY